MPLMSSAPDSAPTIDEQRAALSAAFRERFGSAASVFVVAPGRVNLIGEHIDYCEGFVLPMAIERQTMIAARPRADTLAHFESTGVDGAVALDLREPIAPGEGGWAEYVRGPVKLAMDAGLKLEHGFDALIDSTVPTGSGLSSSAAIEVATATLVEALAGRSLDPVAKALLCQRAEHEYAGVPCGIMDQFISAMGVEDAALLIDCRDHTTQRVPLGDPALSVLIINSNVKHALTGGEYAQRRAQTEAVLAQLGAIGKDWRSATPADLQALQPRLDEVTYRRGRHVIGEIERTTRAADAMRSGDWGTVGQLMFASHASLRDDFEVSTPELDQLVELAREHVAGGAAGDGAVWGSRMTGGGFGGCTVTLVRTDRAEAVLQSVMDAYQAATGIEPSGFVSRPAAGAQVLD